MKRLAGVALCAALCATTTLSPVPAAADTIGGKIARGFLSEARQQAEALLASVDNVAQFQVRHLANQLLILINETERLIGKQIDKVINALDENIQKVLFKIDSIQQTLNDGVDRVVSLEDDVALDLSKIVGDTIFAKHSFLMKRITGLQHVQQEGRSYRIQFKGSEFGSSKVKLTKVTLGDDDVTGRVQINQPGLHDVWIDFPPEVMAARFSPDKMRVPKIVVHFERYEVTGWWFWREERKKGELDHGFYIYLYPRYAGDVKFTAEKENFDFVDAGPFTVDKQGANNHCSNDCDCDDDNPTICHGILASWERCVDRFRGTPPQVGDQYLVGPAKIYAIQNGNPYDVGHTAGLTPNGQCLKGSFRARTHPSTYRLEAKLMQFAVVSTSKSEQTQKANFGQTNTLRVHKATKLVLFESKPNSGATLSGEFAAGLDNDFLKVLSRTQIGDEIVYSYTVKYPKRFQ